MTGEFQFRTRGARGALIRWLGHDAVVLENRGLRVTVSVTRGGELLELRDKATDVDALWHAEAGIVAADTGTPSVSDPRGNFLDSFAGGWQEVFPSGGDATTYGGAMLGQHGEVALLPWSWRIDDDSSDRVAVTFTVACRRMPLRLERRLAIDGDRPVLQWSGRVINDSPMPIAYMWGHHLALGAPLVGPGSRLELPHGARCTVPGPPLSGVEGYRLAAAETRWPSVIASGGAATLEQLPPADGTTTHLFLDELPVARGAVRNDELGLTGELRWDLEAYPHVWCWGVFAGHRSYPLWGRHYLMTIEPFTSPFMTLEQAAARSLAPVVNGHEDATAWLEWTFHHHEPRPACMS